ncbi:MAG: NAD(P)-dependent oxidoreductase [Acidimicrobiia bacterium]|jgi:nucleoside-diphosphate-sugar epimerase
MEGKKILVTGPTSTVGLPVTIDLAASNEVWGIARFGNAAAREQLEAAGVRCETVDLATSDFTEIPDDFDYVVNFAIARGSDADWDHDLAANGESVGLLFARCPNAQGFLHCSSTAVYQPAGAHALAETDPLGDNHRVMFATYSIAKIASEVVARTACRQYGVPTTIARLNVPYGDHGGWPWFHLRMMEAGMAIPVHPDRPNVFNPIHSDDIVRQVPKLLEVATVPATIVNWAGAPATVEEWCGLIGELAGLEVKFDETDHTIGSVTTDNTRMHELIGPADVDWRTGITRMVAANHP